MNDAYTKYKPGDPDQNISLEKSLSNLNAMIDQILAANRKTEIILQTMNSVIDIPEHPYENASNRPDLAAYYQGYRDLAKKRGLLLIDNFANWEALRISDPARYRSYLPDGLHPTAPGSLAITFPAVVNALAPGTDKGKAP